MRLTLRTMLAYLDDILEPEDREEIGRKIKDSEFASELVHRMRDMMGRLRLGAPPVLGRGMGQDANTVAEYLDNTLAPERVADFERACLESDIQLAEAAACHQILTLVLGEPAEIDPDMRTRMYAIRDHAEQILQRRADGPHGVATADAPPTETSHQRKPKVPDYLRESARARRRRVLVMLTIAATVVAVAALVLGPGGILTGGSGGEVADLGKVAIELETEKSGAAKTETDRAAETSPVESSPVEPSESPETTSEANTTPLNTTVHATHDEGERRAESGGQRAEEESDPIEDEQDVDASAATELMDDASDEASVDPAETVQPDSDTHNGDTLVGTYGDQKLVLLRYDDEISEWRRMPTRSAVHLGDRLLALPTFRPSISLGNGASVEIVGGTLVTFRTASVAGEALGLDVMHGRLIVTNPMPNAVRLDLGLAAERVTVDLLPQATLAVGVRRHNVPGVDPRLGSGPVSSQMNAVSGVILWGGDDHGQSFEAPDTWYFQSGMLSTSDEIDDAPAWIRGERLSKLDQLASFNLENSLELNRSARLSLRELVSGRSKEEVRSLAARCSLYVGEFEPFVEALSDTEIAPAWRPKLIRALRSAMALGPDVAEQIRLAFVQSRGQQDGTELYELLWRYSSRQIGEDQKQRLVEYLKHDRLEFRLLALWNLFELTGQGSSERLPDPRTNRQQLVKRWEDRLKEGRIVPKTPM